MQPLQSSELRTGQGHDGLAMAPFHTSSGALSPVGSAGKREPLATSINADLIDLTCMLSPTSHSKSSTDSSREEVLHILF